MQQEVCLVRLDSGTLKPKGPRLAVWWSIVPPAVCSLVPPKEKENRRKQRILVPLCLINTPTTD